MRFGRSLNAAAGFILAGSAWIAVADEIRKPEYGIAISLPDRWKINSINGYSKTEFGGSYQLGFDDAEGVANILLLGVDAQPAKFETIEKWMNAVIVNQKHGENLLDWYGSYVIKGDDMEFDRLQQGKTIIGSGQEVATIAPEKLRFEDEPAHLLFVYFPSKTGDRWFCVVIYNKKTMRAMDADLPVIVKGLSLI